MLDKAEHCVAQYQLMGCKSELPYFAPRGLVGGRKHFLCRYVWNLVIFSVCTQKDRSEVFSDLCLEIPELVLQRAFLDSPPADPESYVRYLERQISLTVHDIKHGKYMWTRIKVFLSRLQQEVQRVRLMKNSYCHAFRLCITLILDILLLDPEHLPLCFKANTRGEVIVTLRPIRGRFLKESQPKSVSAEEMEPAPYLDLVGAARRVRNAIFDYNCVRSDCAHERLQSIMALLLDSAEMEIRYNALLMVGYQQSLRN
ncbi:hypothetical protein BDV95DRAFT_67341 [Massariosphaeria phaeospora]|uniref:Uncharacterized protein n=1 Tax=Massariosphaeria phaeospora TaxID=100035 RepID=A0A7C8M936_9PLEO|nr:hypothetical protein BDV95DRAFT_67341 [Massariosphaeria phaeospora]